MHYDVVVEEKKELLRAGGLYSRIIITCRATPKLRQLINHRGTYPDNNFFPRGQLLNGTHRTVAKVNDFLCTRHRKRSSQCKVSVCQLLQCDQLPIV